MMWVRRILVALLAVAVAGLILGLVFGPAEVERELNVVAPHESWPDAEVERELNVVAPHESWPVGREAAGLHQEMLIADLHADTFLWDRDLRKRADRGHVDLVRLREGNVAVQVFAVVTKSPSGQNYDANTAGSDNITPLVMLQGWPVATWDSLGERALYQATRLRELARSDPDLIRLLLTGPDV